MPGTKTIFDYQAKVGLTKHLGGTQATDKVLAMCQVDSDMTILDVGCGVGATPCYVVKKYGCRVVGVDILEAMVERCIERAKRERLEDKTEFRVADAQDLPFEDNTFDVVMTESVTVLPADKQRAVSEYARVTKPGGYVVLNESTWLKEPVPPELVEYMKQDLSANAELLTREGWVTLLEGAGLGDIVAEAHAIEFRAETKTILARYGCRGTLGIFCRLLGLYLNDPSYRSVVKDISQQSRPQLSQLCEYSGYGLYVGRKPKVDDST
jgi:SAM-dependent methyltransferase